MIMDYRCDKFDDIRPYYEDEIPDAMARIAGSGSFPLLASFVYPDEQVDDVRHRIASYTSVSAFQREAMYMFNQRVIENSISSFSCHGLSNLDKSKAYLYVSNHRDIVLDSSLLQYFLVKNGFDTTEITFGSNLMMNQLVVDIGKSNKMFTVERPNGDLKAFYRNSIHLSEYIHHTIAEKRQSAWIAQRNGRTKDGNDATDQGIIKMFCMGCRQDKIDALKQLHIVPVAISYEWEPCDVLKTLELYESQFIKYTKKPGEDLSSILTGILHRKGSVHIELCKPLADEELEELRPLTCNDYYKAVANLIDRRIHAAYRLSPNNYIAHDLRNHTAQHAQSNYTPRQRDEFLTHLQDLERYDTCDIARLKDIYLGIYANPIDNKRRWEL